MTPTATLPRVHAPFEWHTRGGVTWLAAGLEHGRAAFSTRVGGVSEGPYESLNLGILTDDRRERVLRNRAMLLHALGRDPDSVLIGMQVHGAEVQVRDAAATGHELARVDAQVTSAAGLTPLVLAADCVPLVVAARGAVAAVHCGWRGVAAGIVSRAVETVRRLGGDGIAAVVGPGIGPCCYDVGPDVLAAFAARGHEQSGPALDLPAMVAAEASRAGAGDVALAGICVSCTPGLFFSHRRDGGVTGRQAGLAWLGS